MARPLRIEFAGAYYHVTCRGNERKAIFISDADRRRFIEYLKSAHERYGAIINAYCLMGNHYHLMLETPMGNLSQIMHHINASYTTYFNVKRSRAGHLLQGRYKAILVEKEAYGLELSRYIHLNPVRAGMVEKPSDYAWSSYRMYVGEDAVPEWMSTEVILSAFPKARQKGYRKFVEEADAKQSPLDNVFASTILGTAGFITQVQKYVEGGKVRDIPAKRRMLTKPSLKNIQEAVARVVGDDAKLCRKLGLFMSQVYGGYSLQAIADYYAMQAPAVSQSNKRMRALAQQNKKLKNQLDGIKAQMEMSNVET